MEKYQTKTWDRKKSALKAYFTRQWNLIGKTVGKSHIKRVMQDHIEKGRLPKEFEFFLLEKKRKGWARSKARRRFASVCHKKKHKVKRVIPM